MTFLFGPITAINTILYDYFSERLVFELNGWIFRRRRLTMIEGYIDLNGVPTHLLTWGKWVENGFQPHEHEVVSSITLNNQSITARSLSNTKANDFCLEIIDGFLLGLCNSPNQNMLRKKMLLLYFQIICITGNPGQPGKSFFIAFEFQM
jgi:hypothetical protein